jgi:hypothetical protein
MSGLFDHIASSSRRALADPLPAGMRRRPGPAPWLTAEDDGGFEETLEDAASPDGNAPRPAEASMPVSGWPAPVTAPAQAAASRPVAGATTPLGSAERLPVRGPDPLSPAGTPRISSAWRADAPDPEGAAPGSQGTSRAPGPLDLGPVHPGPEPRLSAGPSLRAATPLAARAAALSGAFVAPGEHRPRPLPDLLAAVRARLPPPAREVAREPAREIDGRPPAPPPGGPKTPAAVSEPLFIEQLDVRIVAEEPPAQAQPPPRAEASRAGAWRVASRRYLGWT